MSDELPLNVPGELPLRESADAAGGTEIPQDPDWSDRCRRRFKAALEVLAEAGTVLSSAELQAAVTEHVPLMPYDLSTSTSGHVRAWTNFNFTLTTSFEHAGWLHATQDAGWRITRQGIDALATGATAQELLDQAVPAYKRWYGLRKDALPDAQGDSTAGILHPGSGAAHALRACQPLTNAWRREDSAFAPGSTAWSQATTATLAEYLRHAAAPIGNELPGLDDDTARILAAEALALLVAPLSDMVASTKRARVRGPLMLCSEPPPGLPIQLSADMEHGFVRAGKAFISDPMTALRSLVTMLERWWASPADRRATAWADPWVWRDLFAGGSGVDGRVLALVSVLVHPAAYTTIVRPEDRGRIVEAFADRIPNPTGHVERDLRTAVLKLQAENGSRGVDLEAPPLLGRWSSSVESSGAWLVRGQVDQHDRVPTWVKHGNVTLTAGRFRQLPAEFNQASLTGTVEELYADMPVVKREAKKRDVLAFVLGMQPGDLVVTDHHGHLQLGRVLDGVASLESIGGSTLLMRPVAWSPQPSDKITDLPYSIRGRLRFKGEDVVNLTDILTELERLEDRDAVSPPPDAEADIIEVAVSVDESEPVTAEPVKACHTSALASELHHADDSWLRELLDSLNERRQVILEGPPGTGKTYLAQKLLDACGLTPNERALVQFHPTYSYEDFVEGSARMSPNRASPG